MRMIYRLATLLLTLVSLTSACSAQRPASTYPFGQVTSVGQLVQPRASHTAKLLNDGRVLIAGGMKEIGVYFDSAEIFDGQRDSFSGETIKMLMRRVGHT